MSRFRRFLTFAAKIKHLKKEFLSYRAYVRRAVWSGQQDIRRVLRTYAFSLEAVIPFTVKNYGPEPVSGLVLDTSQLRRAQTAEGKTKIGRTDSAPSQSSTVFVALTMFQSNSFECFFKYR